MARSYRKSRHHRRSTTIPLGIVAGVMGMPGVGNGVIELSRGNVPVAMDWFKSIVGITPQNTFDWGRLQSNIIPLLAGFGVHKAAGMLGVNRAIGQTGLPWIRI